MAKQQTKLQSLSDVGIYTKDLKKSRQFYVRTIGLKLRSEARKWGYVALGPTKGGEDASLNLWQPVESWGPEAYEAGLKGIGGVAGIGFSTTDLKRTVDALKGRGVTADVDESGNFGSFTDPDGNILFLEQPARPKVRRAGLQRLNWITVVSRDPGKTGEFFTQALGMKRRKLTGDQGQDYTNYRLTQDGTAIMPFSPAKMQYENPSDYDADMAHLGENTMIGFSTKDIQGVQEALMTKGVRFAQKAERKGWGWSARFLDPDENSYQIVQM
jgi:catechol 2,3-dioxygenase-like lactoylglutathione lyase family enzyme